MSERRLEFDPNVRHDGFFSTLNDQALSLKSGDVITVYEPEDGIQAQARVERFWGDNDKYVLFTVDGTQLVTPEGEIND